MMAVRRYIEFRRPPNVWDFCDSMGYLVIPSFLPIVIWEILDETETEYLLQRKRTILRFLRKRMSLPRDYPYILKIFTKEE